MHSWTESSRLINDLETEMCYQLSDRFFIGNPLNSKELHDEDLFIKIDFPSFERKVIQIARTSEVQNNEVQLSNYYKNILNKAGNYGKSYLLIHHYFWIRLWFWQTEKDAYISFPWYDTIDEIRNFFSAFKTKSTGDLFHDMDQNWEIEVAADNDYYYIKQTDPGQAGLLIENLKIEKKRMEMNIQNLEDRIDNQIKLLTGYVGIDLWSNREYLYEDVQ